MNPAADIWAKVLALMQNEMTTTTINTWFDDTTAVELEGDRFVLYSPTPFKRDIIASRYLPAIQNALRELFSAEFQVTVLTAGELDRYQQPKKNDLIPGTEEYTFERFVVGSSNKFAHAAARAVADYLALELTRMFLFLVSFALVLLLWLLLSRVLDLACKLPVLSTLNHWSGAALGLVKGGLIVFILCWLLRGSLISQEAVEGTVLLRFFCTHTPLSLLAPLLFR